ncbi:lycopene cyclase domain-containing protein [Rubrivirga marina]|uniref:Lycopene cyclase domain-containing protein n=1 Tax=Rubrivirga marina TaxID=1196024 RepID=A0A271IWU3_9BACT|nr:lycopene cyclase domain-containing protein [Rubrivirga marina]PAP75408.1 hypothetical protein BSZ37_02595 [Rubrivirga marina]
MTYLQFHFVFTLPVLAALALLQGRTREPWWPLALITGIAFVYTTPWDNFLVANEVWTYPPDRVWATIGYVPVEEYAFFVIESVIVGLVVRLLQARWPAEPAAPNVTARVVGTAVFAVLSVVGVACVVAGGRWLYLGLILAWAFPILALMWGLGGHLIWARRRLVAWAVVPTAFYFCLADRVAIGLGIWDITDATRTGWEVAGLPFEEGLFFFVTAQLVAQGLVMLERDALPETVGRLRRARPVPA